MTLGQINRRLRELRDQAEAPGFVDDAAFWVEVQRLLDRKSEIIRGLGGSVVKSSTKDAAAVARRTK
jgi:hypothetical protein